MDLKKFFKSKTIAVVGANDGESFGGAVCKNLLKDIPDKKNIYFVNPKRDNLFEKKCYKSILEIEDDIDLLVIAVNKNLVIDVIKDGIKRNIKNYIVFASGFSETGKPEDIEREKELENLARENDLQILGPNCAGFTNYIDNINSFAFLSEDRDRKGDIGIVSQSGMLSLSIIDNNYSKLSYNISCGNANIIKFNDIARFLIDDENTKVIGMYIDGIKDIDKFEETLSYAKEKNKRVAVLKVGSNEKSKTIVKNHTGSVENFTNDYFNKLLDKYDVIRADDLEMFIYLLTILSKVKYMPKSNRVASLNLSGGEAGIMAEVGYDYNIDFPNFSKNLISYFTEKLPSYANVSNPLDMTVTLSYDSELLKDAIINVLNDENIDSIIFGYTLLQQIDDPCIYYMIEALKKVKEEMPENKKPIFIMSFMSNTRNLLSIEKLMDLGVICLPSPKYGFSIFNKIVGR